LNANPDTYTAPAHGWTCFHCGETFHVEAQARGHFGSDVSGEPMCVMRANAFARVPRTEWPLMYRLRELEAEVEKLRRDSGEDVSSDRAYRARVESDIRGMAVAFKDCRTLRDVFNAYDSMEGRALAAEERLPVLSSELADLRAWKGLLKDGDFQAYAEIKEQHAGLVARIRELERDLAARRGR
jgi:hypothetical protein